MGAALYGNTRHFDKARFKKIRMASHITQDKLGKALDISYSQIKNIESGHTNPSIDSLIRIAEYLHVTTDYLLGISDDPGTYWHDKEY